MQYRVHADADCFRHCAVCAVMKYKVEVTTGSVPKGDTEAQVYIQLHGRMGSTGRRQLKKSLNNDKMFQLGQVGCFRFFTCLSEGLVRVE